MTQAPPGPRPGLASLRIALGLFTVIPVPTVPRLGRDEAAAAVRWLPAVGGMLAVPAAGVLLGVEAGGQSSPRRLLGAALAILLLALLTGGLHLDGLADTADGLGSRRPRDEALAIMRRPDIGPLGAAALLFVTVIQITALATVHPGWPGAAALAVAVATGRAAVVLATGPGTPAARPDGLGALVAGATTARARVATAVVLLALAALAGGLTGGAGGVLRSTGAALAGLAAADLIRRAARRRLGGMTGDIFGAQVELATAAVLVTLALTT